MPRVRVLSLTPPPTRATRARRRAPPRRPRRRRRAAEGRPHSHLAPTVANIRSPWRLARLPRPLQPFSWRAPLLASRPPSASVRLRAETQRWAGGSWQFCFFRARRRRLTAASGAARNNAAVPTTCTDFSVVGDDAVTCAVTLTEGATILRAVGERAALPLAALGRACNGRTSLQAASAFSALTCGVGAQATPTTCSRTAPRRTARPSCACWTSTARRLHTTSKTQTLRRLCGAHLTARAPPAASPSAGTTSQLR